MSTKYIFVTGGGTSSMGKGIVAASLGRLLKNRGLKVTVQKFDPYLNIDPGTMSPYQHGEVFVTDDGAETDLDLGHYERFIDINLNKYSNVTSGKVYSEILRKERKGEYLGATVQMVPHVTNMLKEKIKRAATTTDADIIITEVGGTVGDMESLPFIEALRQMKAEVGADNVMYIHTVPILHLRAAGELKTKIAQNATKTLREYGIQANMLVLRSEVPITTEMRDKIAMFCDVAPEAVIQSLDVEHLYQIPLNLQAQNMDQIVCDHLKLDAPKADMAEWSAMVDHVMNLKKKVKIALVGKYVELPDAYISVTEALKHAGYASDAEVDINWVNANDVTDENVAELVGDAAGIIVPGGFGQRGTEGKIAAIKYARENDVPMLGICLGMQLTAVEFARNVLGLEGAHSFELDPETKYPVIDIMRDQVDVEDMGGTLRLGLYPAKLKNGSRAKAAYNDAEVVQRRHRHRYEFNNKYREDFEKAGFVFSGVSPDNRLVEIVELLNTFGFCLCQNIFCFWKTLVIITGNGPALPAAILSQMDAAAAPFSALCHGFNSSPSSSVRKPPTTSEARFCISPVTWV